MLEEAAAYQQLIEEFGYTHEQVAKRVGKSRTSVTNILRLLQLPAGVQRLLAEGQISPGHARALLGTPDRGYQETLAKAVVSEGLTVRAIEEWCGEHAQEQDDRYRAAGTRCREGWSKTRRLDNPGLRPGRRTTPATTARNSRAGGASLQSSQHEGEG